MVSSGCPSVLNRTWCGCEICNKGQVWPVTLVCRCCEDLVRRSVHELLPLQNYFMETAMCTILGESDVHELVLPFAIFLNARCITNTPDKAEVASHLPSGVKETRMSATRNMKRAPAVMHTVAQLDHCIFPSSE